jgi:hypothetical protein
MPDRSYRRVTKLKNWRGVWTICAPQAAPALEFTPKQTRDTPRISRLATRAAGNEIKGACDAKSPHCRVSQKATSDGPIACHARREIFGLCTATYRIRQASRYDERWPLNIHHRKQLAPALARIGLC